MVQKFQLFISLRESRMVIKFHKNRPKIGHIHLKHWLLTVSLKESREDQKYEWPRGIMGDGRGRGLGWAIEGAEQSRANWGRGFSQTLLQSLHGSFALSNTVKLAFLARMITWPSRLPKKGLVAVSFKPNALIFSIKAPTEVPRGSDFTKCSKPFSGRADRTSFPRFNRIQFWPSSSP